MGNDKPKLTLNQIQELIQQVKTNGGWYTISIGPYSYGLDDVYNHIVSYHDIMMSLMDEIILKKQRL